MKMRLTRDQKKGGAAWSGAWGGVNKVSSDDSEKKQKQTRGLKAKTIAFSLGMLVAPPLTLAITGLVGAFGERKKLKKERKDLEAQTGLKARPVTFGEMAKGAGKRLNAFNPLGGLSIERVKAPVESTDEEREEELKRMRAGHYRAEKQEQTQQGQVEVQPTPQKEVIEEVAKDQKLAEQVGILLDQEGGVDQLVEQGDMDPSLAEKSPVKPPEN